ncbi:MmcQ/YjbR family DNA-binding protein [Myceligenerans indicum]|uniref:MmcQ/YjbR family DNA-binding protein n=1 Tax=Myceligenerans indicum TaxID=2593663 RepID=A0ABS1LPG4_9MICO|nr:MmcQ/YjbR family DNA-binding protein [Myceligenerans indicum]MBL0887959.1 MmcQ/YjbR family DNA-binding protein [Myceligenerans indicum]
MSERAPVPTDFVQRVAAVLERLPDCREHDAWTGVAWKVRDATVGHVFGGEDGLVRITFRAEPDEVQAFQHLGPQYFKASWGSNAVGMVLDGHTDWEELAELLTDSYCIQAPQSLAAQVQRPAPHAP